ncbi:MAG: hypothetical protein JWM74_1949 [Myxococcaceae bacterium]|nr:hypothetical protein [Myxococcaceae bacterium]
MTSKRALLFLVLTAAFLTAFAALAQRPARGRAPAKPPRGKDASAEALDASTPLSTRGENAPREPKDRTLDAGAVESKTLDGGARVFRFGEVEIEGRLRSPQLVYFLRRVRAEFASGDLGHRTFLPELSETRKDPNF